MEIRIFPIKMGLDTVYVVRGEGTILIDSGDPQKIAKFKEGLQKLGIKPEVVSTPGHSWGSVSVVLNNGAAFVGDLATSLFPMRLAPGLPIFGDDLEVVKDSLRKISGMGARTIYPAHGKPFPIEALEKAIAA